MAEIAIPPQDWVDFLNAARALRDGGLLDGAESVDESHRKLLLLPYAKEIHRLRPVLAAFDALEDMYQNLNRHRPERWGPEEIRRRRLIFLLRYAEIVKYKGAPENINRPAESRRECADAAKLCRRLAKQLERIDRDHYVVEALGQHSLGALHEAAPLLKMLADRLAEVRPSFPHENTRGNTRIRIVVDHLVECCGRIYHGCNEKILKGLLGVSWFKDSVALADGELRQWIDEALQRKTDNYERRMSEEDWGEGSTRPRTWEPPTSLDPH
ncbi:hypothetical protein [Uliginosibacterium sp. 31-12]|uniref:hypothetical protein n=1 Tax=Uliginosibacterium sp. 31-12 TaxID=3062781 RepID=UPI0026E23965|nr:hypothetical protein [Uliginosibacterium sp. 31-12]MDO6384699.1 hypothetical protein [Uliginosibacterium sp. 31-12]